MISCFCFEWRSAWVATVSHVMIVTHLVTVKGSLVHLMASGAGRDGQWFPRSPLQTLVALGSITVDLELELSSLFNLHLQSSTSRIISLSTNVRLYYLTLWTTHINTQLFGNWRSMRWSGGGWVVKEGHEGVSGAKSDGLRKVMWWIKVWLRWRTIKAGIRRNYRDQGEV